MQTLCNVPACPIPCCVTSPETSAPLGSAAFSSAGLHASLRLLHSLESIVQYFKDLQTHVKDKQQNRTDRNLKGHRYVARACAEHFPPAVHLGSLPFTGSSLKPGDFTQKSPGPNKSRGRAARWHREEGHATQAALSCRDPCLSAACCQRRACANTCHVCLFSSTGITQ